MRIDSIAFFEAFQKYVADWRELERQYCQIPSWRIIKQLQNIRQREQLTRVYTARMQKWGILESVRD